MRYLLTSLGIFAGDTLLKERIDKNCELDQEKAICKNKIIIRKYYNEGAMLNLLAKHPESAKKLSGTILAFAAGFFGYLLGKNQNGAIKLGMSMMLGGGCSNYTDRLRKGHVVDYVSFHVKNEKLRNIIFNVSDFFIFIGAALVLLGNLFAGDEK